MKTRHWRLLPFALCVGMSAAAQDAKLPEPGALQAVVATVGGVQITGGQVRERYRMLAPFQRRQLGATWSEQRANLIRNVLAPEVRMTLWRPKGEAALGADSLSLRLRDAGLRASSRALRVKLRTEVQSRPNSAGDVDEFYRQQRRFFEAPRAHLLWRILVGTHSKATALLTELASNSGRSWRQMARIESLDEATNMRSGSLGYVQSNGHTHRPQVRVEPALFVAAERLGKQGLVSQPVAEGNYFAIVWRKGTRPAGVVDRVMVDASIRQLLLQQRHQMATESLLERLRDGYLNTYHPEVLTALGSAYWKNQAPHGGGDAAHRQGLAVVRGSRCEPLPFLSARNEACGSVRGAFAC